MEYPYPQGTKSNIHSAYHEKLTRTPISACMEPTTDRLPFNDSNSNNNIVIPRSNRTCNEDYGTTIMKKPGATERKLYTATGNSPLVAFLSFLCCLEWNIVRTSEPLNALWRNDDEAAVHEDSRCTSMYTANVARDETPFLTLGATWSHAEIGRRTRRSALQRYISPELLTTWHKPLIKTFARPNGTIPPLLRLPPLPYLLSINKRQRYVSSTECMERRNANCVLIVAIIGSIFLTHILYYYYKSRKC